MGLLLKEFRRISLKKKVISEECVRSEKTTKYIGKAKKKSVQKYLMWFKKWTEQNWTVIPRKELMIQSSALNFLYCSNRGLRY